MPVLLSCHLLAPSGRLLLVLFIYLFIFFVGTRWRSWVDSFSNIQSELCEVKRKPREFTLGLCLESRGPQAGRLPASPRLWVLLCLSGVFRNTETCTCTVSVQNHDRGDQSQKCHPQCFVLKKPEDFC